MVHKVPQLSAQSGGQLDYNNNEEEEKRREEKTTQQ